MSRAKRLSILIVGLLLSIFLFAGIGVKAEENKVLIVYDTYNEFGEEENKLNSLVQLIIGTNSGIDIVSANDYSEALIDKYNVLFVLYNNYGDVPRNLTQDLLKFKGKVVWIGKNFTGTLSENKNIIYIPSFSSKEESYNVVDKNINTIIYGKEKKQENIYLLIDKIYPFIDLNKFVEKIDFLYDQGIPFVCSVMPVYENQDFDAMKRFCEVLRYAQSKGGKIILHSSVLYGESIPGKDVKGKMDLAQQIYVKYGVYPLALDIPEDFLYKEDYKDLIHSSNEVFIEEDKQMGVIELKRYSIDKFDRIIHKVDTKDEYKYKAPESIHNIAFSLNADLDLESFKSEINKLIDKRISFNDLGRLDSVMKLGGIELKATSSDILLNNEPINEQEEKSKSQAKTNNKNESIDISSANGKILKITTIICAFFVIVVLASLKIDREKFFDYRG